MGSTGLGGGCGPLKFFLEGAGRFAGASRRVDRICAKAEVCANTMTMARPIPEEELSDEPKGAGRRRFPSAMGHD